RGATEHRAGGNPDARPEPDVALQHRVWSQQAAVPDLHLWTDDRIGTDLHLVPQFRARVHHPGRMHRRQGHLSTTQAIISASVTTCASTVATPLSRAILPRNWSISTSIRSWSPGTTGLRNFTASRAMK